MIIREKVWAGLHRFPTNLPPLASPHPPRPCPPPYIACLHAPKPVPCVLPCTSHAPEPVPWIACPRCTLCVTHIPMDCTRTLIMYRHNVRQGPGLTWADTHQMNRLSFGSNILWSKYRSSVCHICNIFFCQQNQISNVFIRAGQFDTVFYCWIP